MQTEIDPNDPAIPERMRTLVRYLNRLLECCPVAVTALVDHKRPIPREEMERLDQVFPYIVLRGETHDDAEMSGLGLLSGFVNTDRYTLFASFENDNQAYGKILKFGVFKR